MGAVILSALALFLSGCAALHSPIDERPTIRGIANSNPGGETTTDEEVDTQGEASDDESTSPLFSNPSEIQPVPAPDPRRRPSRGSATTNDDSDGDAAVESSFEVYLTGDKRLNCGELDRSIAQLQGQSAAPIAAGDSQASTVERSTGLVSRIMDSAVVSGIRETITGEPSKAELEEQAIRQRIEWLRELKSEKGCYTTQPLF